MNKQQWAEIAKLYYIEGLSQDEIAKKLYVSRSSVSRIISKCVEEGIVEITIHDPMTKHPEVCSRLRNRFGLRDVIICQTGATRERTEREAGILIAAHLENMLKKGMLLGIGNGSVCFQAARRLKANPAMKVDVIQLQGGTSEKLIPTDGQSLVNYFGAKLGGDIWVLQAPVLVKSKAAKRLLMESEMISNTMKKHSEIDIAIMEIGMPQTKLGLQFREPWLTRADATQLKEQLAVACVCGYYLDENGLSCNAGINDRNMSIEYSSLIKIPVSMGIALGGKMKIAVKSVLMSGMINTLVIDEELAYELDEE